MGNMIKGASAASPHADYFFGLDEAFMDVREFHQAFEHPCPGEPTIQPLDRACSRGEWINEEVEELCDAETLEDQVDAYIDILYFALGGLVECGVLPDKIFAAVHAANMAKMHIDENGKTFVKRREDGKIVKPDGWAENHAPEPKIRAEIDAQKANHPLYGWNA